MSPFFIFFLASNGNGRKTLIFDSVAFGKCNPPP